MVGSSAQLGSWTLDGAVPLTWGEGHRWTGSVALPEGREVEFKFVITRRNQ